MDNGIDKCQFKSVANTMTYRGRTKECCVLADLVDKGLATKHEPFSYRGDGSVFSLTEEGIAALEANDG